MQWIECRSNEELVAFERMFNRASTSSVSVDELRTYRVFAAREGNEIVGGYWVIPKPPFRSLAVIPKEYMAADPFFASLDGKHIIEVGGLWKARSVKGAGPNLKFFIGGGRIVLRHLTRKTYLLFGYDHRVPHLRALYCSCDAYNLYRGPVVLPGIPGGIAHGTLCAIPLRKFISGTFLAVARHIRRKLAPDKLKNRLG